MNPGNLTKQAERNIHYKISKLEALCSARRKTNEKYLHELLQLNSSIDQENATLNQAFTDAILNSMASLIDYYCIYCLIRVGVPEEKITRIQYRSLNNKFLIDSSGFSKKIKESPSIDALRKVFDIEISSCCGLEIKDINVHDYWICFLGDAISTTLHEYAITNDKRMKLIFDSVEGRFKIESVVRQYYFYMRFLFCNHSNNAGAKYSIYIDINNFLKHNSVPYLTTKIESFEDEQRAFTYLEIKNHDRIFFKNGILKSIIEIDFDTLKKDLELKHSHQENYDFLCPLEEDWGLGRILKTDTQNGYISKDKATLYFFIDGILMAKNRESTLVDADLSLIGVLRELIREIKQGMKLDFSSI